MIQYKDDRTGMEVVYSFVKENEDLSFFYRCGLFTDSDIFFVSYFVEDKNIDFPTYDTKELKITDLKEFLASENVFSIDVERDKFLVRFSGAELWVFSKSKSYSKNIFKTLYCKNKQ